LTSIVKKIEFYRIARWTNNPSKTKHVEKPKGRKTKPSQNFILIIDE